MNTIPQFITPAGRLDSSNFEYFEQQLEDASRLSTNVVLDLNQVDHMASVAIGTMISYAYKLKVEVVNCPDSIAQTFELLGTDLIIHIKKK